MSHSTKGADDGDFAEVSVDTESEAQSFEARVNTAVTAMKQNEEGLWVVPENLPPEVAYAANLEKRRRDTQSALAKTSQELEATKTQADKLKSKLKETFKVTLSDDQAEELEGLKVSDPEAYRQKMNEFESEASQVFEDELSSMGYDEEEVSEMATRAVQLTEFLSDNPGFVLNDEVFENDLPPRITGKLIRGEVSFTDFLVEAKEFLTKGTKVANTDSEEEEPDLSNAGGDSTVSKKALAGDSDSSYKNEIY